MSERFIATVFTRAVLDAADAEGIDTSVLRKRIHGLEQIPESTHEALWAELMGASDEAFPLRYAQRMSIDDYGVLGLAAKTAPHLEGALRRVARHLGIWTNTIAFEVNVGERLSVRLHRAGRSSLGARAATEATVAEVVHVVRAVAAEPVAPVAVSFAHAAPASLDAFTKFFGVEPAWDATHTGFELPVSAAGCAVRSADPALSSFFEAHLARLEPPATEATLAARAADVVRRQLADGPPKVEDVAAALQMSTRSLQRHLTEASTSFRDVVDDARRTAALDHLERTELPIAEIAFLLGYSEVSAFSRAFKRWTDQTPAAYRRSRAPGRVR